MNTQPAQPSPSTPLVVHVAIIALGLGYAFAVAVLGAIAFRDGNDPLASQAMNLLGQIVTWTVPALVLLVGGQTALTALFGRIFGSASPGTTPPASATPSAAPTPAT